MWWYSQLLGEEREEETNEVKEEREEHYDGQIIAFESRILDYINEQHYHGLVSSFSLNSWIGTERWSWYTCCIEERTIRYSFMLWEWIILWLFVKQIDNT